MTDISRRDFLKLTRDGLLTLAGLLGLGGVIRFFSYQTDPPPPTEINLGPSSNYLPGSRTLLANAPAVLINTDGSFTAISLVCTHLGCTLESKNEGFECPCHGSRFDTQGKVKRGPASQPLRKLQVEELLDGNLLLHIS